MRYDRPSLRRAAFGWTALLISPAAICHDLPDYDAVYVIGDSSVDTGNFNLSPPLPKKDRPYYFRGRFSDSYIWADLLTVVFTGHYSSASGPFSEPYLAERRAFVPAGTNYAYGGAVTGDGPDLAPPRVPSMQAQAAALLAATPRLSSNALVLVSGGGNDFVANDLLTGTQKATVEHVALCAAENIAQLVHELARAGGRHFLVNVSSEDSVDPQPGRFREQLTQRLELIIREFPDIQLVPFDSSAVFARVLSHAADYGITDPVRGCFVFDLSAPAFVAYTFDPNRPAPTADIKALYRRRGTCRDTAQHLLVDGLHDSSPVQAALAHAALEALSVAPGTAKP